MTDIPTSRKANKVSIRNLSPGETLEGYGINPSDVVCYEDATYSREDGYGGVETQELLRVWYITEAKVPVEDCSDCGSEKVYKRSEGDFLCPHCDIT